MLRKLYLLVFVSACMLFVILGGVLAQDNSVLRVAATASVTTWDPSLSFSTEALYLTNIYEPLLYANAPGSAEAFRPALATDWSASDDGMTWTFHAFGRALNSTTAKCSPPKPSRRRWIGTRRWVARDSSGHRSPLSTWSTITPCRSIWRIPRRWN